MPGIFSRRKKDGKSKKNGLGDSTDLVLQKQKWDDAWTRKTVEPEEVRELLYGCTEELKNRGRIYQLVPIHRHVVFHGLGASLRIIVD
jgi:hypothetical protein